MDSFMPLFSWSHLFVFSSSLSLLAFLYLLPEVVPDSSCTFPALESIVNYVSKDLLFLLLEVVLRNYDLGARYTHHYWSVITSGPTQWVELGNITCVLTHVYICFHINFYKTCHVYIMYIYISHTYEKYIINTYTHAQNEPKKWVHTNISDNGPAPEAQFCHSPLPLWNFFLQQYENVLLLTTMYLFVHL